MSSVMTILFWTASCLVVYTYVGYFLIMRLLARTFRKEIVRDESSPTVTIIIAAYNEQKHIVEKLVNVLELEYPPEKLNVIVGSDASSDETDQLVQEFADPRVSLLRVEGRLGKTIVQNRCVEVADGEILVFTDSTTQLRADSLTALVSNFGSPNVGCAGARLIYRSDTEGQTERGGVAYWSYEALLKQYESDVNSLIGVSGCYYAVRRENYIDIDPELISDFVIALDVVQNGQRVVYAADAVCEEETLTDFSDEFSMRVRVVLRSLGALAARRHLLNPLRWRMFALQLWSHKVLRYTVWIQLIAIFVSSAILSNSMFFGAILALQVVFYALGFVGFVLNRFHVAAGPLAIPYYFCLANAAAFWATVKFITGQRVTVWTPKR